MNNRKPIPRSELLYPHVVERTHQGLYKILDTSCDHPKTVGAFFTEDEAIAHAKELNQLYLQSTGWFLREKRAHDNEEPRLSLTLVLALLLTLVSVLHLLEHIRP